MDDPRYPIGRFAPPATFNPEVRAGFIQQIHDLPDQLRAAVDGLDDGQLRTPYRDGGWTAAQVVHHLADSHINAYTRTRLALTEAAPVIKAYDENAWAKLPDASSSAVTVSLDLLRALHERWVSLLRGLGAEDFARTFVHPEHGPMSLDRLLALYAWHGLHHVAHITRLRDRQGWR